jgi:DNA-binding NarL/FixJ family response regulator
MPDTKPAARSVAKVLIVDDHPAVREALVLRISKVRDLEVCGEASDEAEALKLFAELRPDVAVVDISLRSGDGLDLIKRIKTRDREVRILVWSMHSESLYAERSLRAGAHGYITKEQATSQIVAAIHQVLAGKVYLSPAMTETLLNRVAGAKPEGLAQAPVAALSDRELEVLRLIGAGVRTADIATQLHLSIKTIETYRDRIRQKLSLADGNELIRYAAQWILKDR